MAQGKNFPKCVSLQSSKSWTRYSNKIPHIMLTLFFTDFIVISEWAFVGENITSSSHLWSIDLKVVTSFLVKVERLAGGSLYWRKIGKQTKTFLLFGSLHHGLNIIVVIARSQVCRRFHLSMLNFLLLSERWLRKMWKLLVFLYSSS